MPPGAASTGLPPPSRGPASTCSPSAPTRTPSTRSCASPICGSCARRVPSPRGSPHDVPVAVGPRPSARRRHARWPLRPGAAAPSPLRPALRERLARPRGAGARSRLAAQRATAIGRAILVSLDAIFEGNEDDLPSAAFTNADPSSVTVSPKATLPPLPGRQKAPASIVLLTDGQNNQFPPPLAVVDQATSRAVRVST